MTRKIIGILLLHILFIWWSACMMAAIATHSSKDESWYYKLVPDNDSIETLFLYCFYRAIYMDTLVGYGSVGSRVFLDHLNDFVCLTVGFGLYVFWIGKHHCKHLLQFNLKL